MRDHILGVASHDLSNAKTTIPGAAPATLSKLDGNQHERFSCAPDSRRVFFKRRGIAHTPHKLPPDDRLLTLLKASSATVLAFAH